MGAAECVGPDDEVAVGSLFKTVFSAGWIVPIGDAVGSLMDMLLPT
jgi:hypothetical protein